MTACSASGAGDGLRHRRACAKPQILALRLLQGNRSEPEPGRTTVHWQTFVPLIGQVMNPDCGQSADAAHP